MAPNQITVVLREIWQAKAATLSPEKDDATRQILRQHRATPAFGIANKFETFKQGSH